VATNPCTKKQGGYRMDNELRIICDLLNGYKKGQRFQIVSAERKDDGVWSLFIERIKEEDKQEVTNENN
jgi:hypothetical protein